MSRPRIRALALGIGCLAALTACQAMGSGPVVNVLDQAEADCQSLAAGADMAKGITPTVTVARDADAWRKTLVNRTDGAPAADWVVDFAGGQTVLKIDAGARPNPGWKLQVGRPWLDAERGVLQVPAAVRPPAPDAMYPQMVTHACTYLRLSTALYRSIEVVPLDPSSR